MTLPSFLGLGALRSGSTWLDYLLRRHPRIHMPPQQKEINYFDRYYYRGLDWYQRFFPPEAEKSTYDAIGEVTPSYLWDPGVPGRIKDLLPDCRFLIILRNPAERAYSDYKLRVQHRGVKCGFAEYLRKHPYATDQGFYARQIKRYFALFPREWFQILFFERAVREPEATCRRLAEFLSLDAALFDLAGDVTKKKPNASSLPRFHRTYLSGSRLARVMRACGQSWLVSAARDVGLRDFFREGKPFPPLDAASRERLLAQYAEDISELEALLDVDLGFWRHQSVAPPGAATVRFHGNCAGHDSTCPRRKAG